MNRLIKSSQNPFNSPVLPMQRYFSALFCALVVLSCIPSLAQAPPSADAYVTTTQPNSNFGSSSLLPVQPGTTSYIRLNLGILPANPPIAKATLRLYVNAVVAPGSFDVYQVGNAWTERGISFSSAPQLGPSATGGHPVSITSASRNQFVLIDITPLVQAWASGSIPNNGVALALSGVTGSFSFDSKESSGHGPELELVLGSAPIATLGASSPSNQLTNPTMPMAPADPYIDNGTSLQTEAAFNIDGSGSANSFNSATAYQIGGASVFTIGTPSDSNLFIGSNAGTNNVSGTGQFNVFVGASAGLSNTTGVSNMFLGTGAGQSNLSGSYNTFIGTWSGVSNSTGHHNIFVGAGAGHSVTTAQYDTMFGTNSGLNTTTGEQNAFFGGGAGLANTSGSVNVFFGTGAGSNNTTGSNNVYIGSYAGYKADAMASNNIDIGTQGAAGENNTIRIGDPANQTSAFLAGVNGASTASGVPVFIDSTGKLGTAGGSVSFTQVTGTVTSPQLTGTYSNQVVLSNPTNSFSGTFAGNGSALAGVTSGLSWPIVKKSSNYAVQATDFSTPTTVGNFLIATGTTSLTFTLPNPAPPNGDCVAIGNVIDAGINSGTNTFLTVNGNGLPVDATAGYNPAHPRRADYFYCSDGSGYFRLGFTQNGVSEIGPWIKTYDTGTVNVMTSTYRNGMDFGLTDGTLIYLLPKFANTSAVVTLNLNGLGPYRIFKYGNQALASGDLSTTAYAHLIWNVNGAKWELLNPQTNNGTVTAVTATAPLVSSGGATPNISCPTCITTAALTGTTGSIGGGALTAGSCTSGTASVTGATVGHPVYVSASDGSLPNPFTLLSAAVTSASTVTVQLCAVASNTPAAKTYNVATQ
jgi:hypothetical protein